jgi:hypothetical protein
VNKKTITALSLSLAIAFAAPAHAWTIGGFFSGIASYFSDKHRSASGAATGSHSYFKAYSTTALAEKANAEKAGRKVEIGATSMRVTMPDGSQRTYVKATVTSVSNGGGIDDSVNCCEMPSN